MFTKCICTETRKEFLMRFEEIGHTAWQLVDTYENPLAAFFGTLSVQTFGDQKLSGEFTVSPDYKGCPFCRANSFFVCGSCGLPNCNESVTLTDGKSVSVSCAKCGNTGELCPLEELSLAEDYSINSK
ncbi:MAG TPA: hypothetical protein DCX06_10445 [Opitutae bacterium]|nr:hypothetical protein [Opitutae bacterium]